MKFWNDIDGSIFLNQIFKSPVPIGFIELSTVNIDNNRPTIILEFDIEELPDAPPAKWKKGIQYMSHRFKLQRNQQPDDQKHPPDSLDPLQLSQTTQRTISTRLRAPKNPAPISHVFTLLPNIDTETLLSHACETLASLRVLTTDFACELEGWHRSLALSIQQLAVLGELLVNRALDNLDPPGGVSHAEEVQP
jgi:hypothetical protein